MKGFSVISIESDLPYLLYTSFKRIFDSLQLTFHCVKNSVRKIKNVRYSSPVREGRAIRRESRKEDDKYFVC